MSSPLPAADRTSHRAAGLAPVEDYYSNRRRDPRELPDPVPLVHNLTRCIFEIIIGARDIDQVARWVDPEVLAKMEQRVALDRRARGSTGRRAVWPRVEFGSSLIERPADDVVECVTVIHTPARARALAMRLVGVEGRWRATKIALL